ncbi:uncharacterized protein LOC131166402 [Malania oleifera]|uniref:uncharacterized protein LOC131166402 n=1 Tax=Malania oleifera TaxID=397392 RepID=UPI0025ADACCA|nr:uncharacterized protein LOC131166402 [Malania oleifera]
MIPPASDLLHILELELKPHLHSTTSHSATRGALPHKTAMKACLRALTVLSLLLLVLPALRPVKTRVTGLRPLLAQVPSSQALKDVQAATKNVFKQLGTSVRRIPPSTSNPIQNKSKPPSDGKRKA